MIALPVDQYEALARNTAAINSWVGEAKWRLDYYRTGIEKARSQDSKTDPPVTPVQEPVGTGAREPEEPQGSSWWPF